MEYLKILGLTFGIVGVLFALFILIGTYLGTTWFLITFGIVCIVGIIYWQYIEKKNRCKYQK